MIELKMQRKINVPGFHRGFGHHALAYGWLPFRNLESRLAAQGAQGDS